MNHAHVMSAQWQQLIVLVIVALACVSVARRYAPLAFRRAVRQLLARGARALYWQALAQKMETVADSGGSCATGCGPCKGCGSAGTTESVAVPVLASGPGVTRNSITPEALKRTIARPQQAQSLPQ